MHKTTDKIGLSQIDAPWNRNAMKATKKRKRNKSKTVYKPMNNLLRPIKNIYNTTKYLRVHKLINTK